MLRQCSINCLYGIPLFIRLHVGQQGTVFLGVYPSVLLSLSIPIVCI